MTFNIDIFIFHCKNERKQVKWNEIKRDMCKSSSIFPYFQLGTLFGTLSQNWIITVAKEKSPSFNFIL